MLKPNGASILGRIGFKPLYLGLGARLLLVWLQRGERVEACLDERKVLELGGQKRIFKVIASCSLAKTMRAAAAQAAAAC